MHLRPPKTTVFVLALKSNRYYFFSILVKIKTKIVRVFDGVPVNNEKFSNQILMHNQEHFCLKRKTNPYEVAFCSLSLSLG